jgi:hypothetical protein
MAVSTVCASASSRYISSPSTRNAAGLGTIEARGRQRAVHGPGQIGAHHVSVARRRGSGTPEHRFLVIEDLVAVDLEHADSRRPRNAERPRVHAGGQDDHLMQPA